MSKGKKNNKDVEKYLDEARKNFEEMQKIIAPFLKPQQFEEYLTEDQWRLTSSLHS